MSEANGHVDIDHHVRIYMIVFGALAALTVITVGVSYLHVPVMLAIGLALVIAVIKGSLVACYFMHLISEKKLIYWVLALTVLFFLFALMIPTITDTGNIHIRG